MTPKQNHSYLGKKNLNVYNIECDFIFTIDPGYFYKDENNKKRFQLFSDCNWPEDLFRLTTDDRINEIHLIGSEYNRHRHEKGTLPSYSLDELSPLSLSLTKPINLSIGPFTCQLERVLLSKDCSITFPFNAITHSNNTPEKALSTINIVSEMTLLRQKLREKLSHVIQFSIAVLSANNIIEAPEPFEIQYLLNKTHSFEIIDFDYILESGEKPFIEEFTKNPSWKSSRQLVGLLRMTREEVMENYKDELISSFLKKNLGNRRDELWIVHGQRLLHYHSEYPHRTDVQLWYKDVKNAITILQQKLSALEYLNFSIHRDLSRIKKLIGENPSVTIEKSAEYYTTIVQISYRIADPMLIERNVAHNFFRILLTKVSEETQIPKVYQTTRTQMADLQDIFYSLSNQAASANSIIVAEKTEILTKRVYWLTFLVIILMILQIGIAFLSLPEALPHPIPTVFQLDNSENVIYR